MFRFQCASQKCKKCTSLTLIKASAVYFRIHTHTHTLIKTIFCCLFGFRQQQRKQEEEEEEVANNINTILVVLCCSIRFIQNQPSFQQQQQQQQQLQPLLSRT